MDLRVYWEQELQHSFVMALEDEELGLTVDTSDFVVVDGEEGDYGMIRYLDSNDEVVATKFIQGGDMESLDVTKYGRQFLGEKILRLFQQTLQQAGQHNAEASQ